MTQLTIETIAPVASIQQYESGSTGSTIIVNRDDVQPYTIYGVNVPAFRVEMRDWEGTSVHYLTQSMIDGLALDNDWREVAA